MPSTMKELISKDSTLKSKYGKLLSIEHGDFDQSEIEKFCAKHPQIHDDLANHYIDQIMKRTSAKTVEDIAQAWLYGISGFNKQAKKGIDFHSTPRNQKARMAYNTSLGSDDEL
jgi:hypothetical protein